MTLYHQLELNAVHPLLAYAGHVNRKIPFIKNEILRMAERYKDQTANHDNELIEEL
jgi:hypothetical protein